MKASIFSFFIATTAAAFAACSTESSGDGDAAGASGESGSSGSSSGGTGLGGSGSPTGGSSSGGSAGTAGGGATGGSATGGSSGTSGSAGSGQSGSAGAPTGPGCDHAPAVESCDDRGADPPGGCTEYYVTGLVASQMCPITQGNQGTYSDGPCPTSGALGYCHHNTADILDFGLFHYQEDTLGVVMTVCTNSGGSWCEL